MIRTVSTDKKIADALKRSQALGEIGVQVAVYVDNELVVDAWVGKANQELDIQVDGNTLFPIFSVTKVLPILAVHIQAEHGLVDYAAPVARYWPEYAMNGKGDITVQHVLNHRAGVPNMPDGVGPENIGDWEWMVDQLAKLPPLFPTNTRSTYLGYTYGWILGEIVRRTDPLRRSFQEFIDQEIKQPLRITDLFLGIPDSHLARCAWVYTHDWKDTTAAPAPFRDRAIPARVAPGEAFNGDLVRKAVFPSAGAIANARSLARIFALLANGGQLDGVRLLSEDRVRSFTRPRQDPFAIDEVIGKIAVTGDAGFRLASAHPDGEPLFGDSKNVIGHPGAGGSVGWADIERRFGVAICHNRMFVSVRGEAGMHPFDTLADTIRDLVETRSA